MGIHVLATRLAQQGGSAEPQRQSNWNFEITGLGSGQDSDIISLSLVGGFLPEGANEEVAIGYGNEFVYVAGKAQWNAGQIVLRDFVDMRTAAILNSWRTKVYNPATGRIGLAAEYKKMCYITLFGPNQDEIAGNIAGGVKFERVWQLIGCWPQSINYASNGLDMNSGQVVQIAMNIRYDKAIPERLETSGSGGNFIQQIVNNPLSVVGL